MFQVKSILIFWSLKIWLSFVILLRFSQTCEFWSSKASWRLLFSLLSIILTDLLENKTLLLITGSKGHGFWFVIGGFRSVLCVSVFQGSLLVVIVIMIDGSQKRNSEGGIWTLEFACLWKAQKQIINRKANHVGISTCWRNKNLRILTWLALVCISKRFEDQHTVKPRL